MQKHKNVSVRTDARPRPGKRETKDRQALALNETDSSLKSPNGGSKSNIGSAPDESHQFRHIRISPDLADQETRDRADGTLLPPAKMASPALSAVSPATLSLPPLAAISLIQPIVQRKTEESTPSGQVSEAAAPLSEPVQNNTSESVHLISRSQGGTTIHKPTVSFATYHGATIKEVEHALQDEAGSLTFDISVQAQGDPISAAEVTIKQMMMLPRWAEEDKQCPPVRASWNVFAAALKTHEDGHVAINSTHLLSAHRRLIGEQAANVQFISDQLENEVQSAQDDYDAKTDHGRNGTPPTVLDLNVTCADAGLKGSDSDLRDAGPPDATTVMAKSSLTVGSPDDPSEREADRIADHIVGMETQAEGIWQVPLSIQRCEACGSQLNQIVKNNGSAADDVKCPNCLVADERLQRRNHDDDSLPRTAPDQVEQVLTSTGLPLDSAARNFMEPRFGHDFSRVRIHTDETASRSAESVSALAYTIGSHIVFSDGRYAPESSEGRRLLAHELTHVIQQRASSSFGKVPSTPPQSDVPSGLSPLKFKVNRVESGFFVPDKLQRFSGPEHEQLGNSTHASINLGNGVTLTWGQVVALAGDEYGTADELVGEVATVEGKKRLWGRLLHARLSGIPDSLTKEGSPDRSQNRYVALLLQNISHFAAGGTAVDSWRSYHEQALLSAALSGINNDENQWQRAQLLEAFGQHFLTDSFSAGHIRTPRAAIVTWYENVFGPSVSPTVLTYLESWLTKKVTEQVKNQLGLVGLFDDHMVESEVSLLVSHLVSIFEGEILEFFWRGIAGAISGVLHDQDNLTGVLVSSEAHPDPWRAYGDDHLEDSRDSQGFNPSRDQAERAVLTAREQLVEAQSIGRTRGRHADTTDGENGLQTADLSWVQQTLKARFGEPPYRSVERYIPHDEPGENDPQEDWHWGSFTSTMKKQVDEWIANVVHQAEPAILGLVELNPRYIPVSYQTMGQLQVATVKVDPRLIVQELLSELIKDPTGMLGGMVGRASSDKTRTPAP